MGLMLPPKVICSVMVGGTGAAAAGEEETEEDESEVEISRGGGD